MLVKMYWTLWAVIAALALLVLITGNFTMLMLVVFGFVAFGMIFMGMMSVLPATVAHPAPPEIPEPKVEKAREEGAFQPNQLAVR